MVWIKNIYQKVDWISIWKKLNKAYNKDKSQKQAILDLGNEVLEAASKLSYDPQFGSAMYELASKPHSLASYRTIINLLKQAKALDEDAYYRGAVTNKKGDKLLSRPAPKGLGKGKPAPKRTRAQIKADKIAKLEQQLNDLKGK